MVHRSIPRLLMVAGTVVALCGLLTPSTFAAAPFQTGQLPWNDSIDMPDFCGDGGSGGMHVRLDTQGWEAYTVWADENGDVTKVLYRVRAPHDVFTNLDTGRQIVVRGEFQETIVRTPGTDTFTKTITGFRYLINEPGAGVVVQEVGRITYGDLEQTIVLWQAGKHDLVYDRDFVLFCDLLGQPA
jgi:hypothetical protein